MTDTSKDEMEINSIAFEKEEAANCVSTMREASERAGTIAKTIGQLKIELNDMLNNCDDAKTREMNVCRINKQLTEMGNEYKDTIAQVLKLANIVNIDVDDLGQQQTDADQQNKVGPVASKEYKGELLAPWIIVKDSNTQNLFTIDPKDNEHNIIDNNESFCSCYDESEETVCNDCDNNQVIKNCCDPSETPEIDHEKDAVRDDLMATIGEVKLLHQQNRDLLNKLNTTNQRTTVLSNTLRNKPNFVKCIENGKSIDFCGSTEAVQPDSQDLVCEVNRLRNELNELKRDRCQIELARKILNVSASKCVNCVGSMEQNDNNKNELIEITAKYKCILADRNAKSSEIADLRNKFDAANHDAKKYKECLTISKARVCQLEKELFKLKSVKSHDTDVVCSNDKYLIENLKHRLHEAKVEVENMKMVLDFHVYELEDKKDKFLAVLQTNEEQKHRIEILCKEKSTIAKEYEDEFNRMDCHLKARLEEIGTLPGQLASLEQDLERERSEKMILTDERDALLSEITSLKATLELGKNDKNDKIVKDLEEQKTQLTATVMNLKANLEENKRLYMERTHYALTLNEHLNAVREEAAIQVTKITDFAECQKVKNSEYVLQLEKQLAESRAIACSEFKKRDHIDERLRNRIELLTNNLNEAHKKIAELDNAKKLMETKTGQDLCKVPRVPQILNAVCYR